MNEHKQMVNAFQDEDHLLRYLMGDDASPCDNHDLLWLAVYMVVLIGSVTVFWLATT